MLLLLVRVPHLVGEVLRLAAVEATVGPGENTTREIFRGNYFPNVSRRSLIGSFWKALACTPIKEPSRARLFLPVSLRICASGEVARDKIEHVRSLDDVEHDSAIETTGKRRKSASDRVCI